MIDNNLGDLNGWAVFLAGADPTSPQTAVFETVADLTTPGISIRMFQNYSSIPGHTIGRFRWSYTTDNRADFADGLQTGGDVTANWTVMTPTEVSAGPAFGSTILGDGSVLMNLIGATATTVEYRVTFGTSLAGATGLRLEALADTSLPFNGPGMYTPNGNFVVTEVQVQNLTVVAAGTVTLSDYVGSYSSHSVQLSLSNGTTTIHSATVALSPSGAYSFAVPATVAPGTYMLSADPPLLTSRSPTGTATIRARLTLRISISSLLDLVRLKAGQDTR